MVIKFNAANAVPLTIDPSAKFVPTVNEPNPPINGFGVKALSATIDITLPFTLFNITSYVPSSVAGSVATIAPVSVEVEGPTVVQFPEL